MAIGKVVTGPLSQDELTVLMIAAEDQPMIPIGRWKEPAENLVARGFLQPTPSFQDATGNFNLRITDAGRKAASQDEDNSIRDMISVNNAIVAGKKQARDQANQIATQLVDLAELSNKITGEDRKVALERWARIILTRALEMIGA